MNSTNIKVISEEIQRLKDQVHAIDVEVPDPSDATDGQILSVDNGKYVISDPELPSYSVSDEGKYLGVDSSGDLEFSNPPGKYNLDFSETEVNTGRKFGNTDVYCITFTGDTPDADTSSITIPLSFDTLINTDGVVITTAGETYFINRQLDVHGNSSKTGLVMARSSNVVLQDTPYILIAYYTKPNPVPGNETKKKTTKKGE